MVDQSLAEIDKEIARLQALRVEAERQDAERKAKEHHAEAVKVIDRMIEDIRRLHEIGYLPPKLQAALTDGQGKFNPGMYVKRPPKRD
jgi:hypothetical protein